MVAPRGHDHPDDEAAGGSAAHTAPPEGHVRLSGRSRENKLVHFSGPTTLLGSLVDVRIEAAGAYSLRGALA